MGKNALIDFVIKFCILQNSHSKLNYPEFGVLQNGYIIKFFAY